MSPFLLPTPEEVGEFYNRTNRLIAQFQGGNMHYGYWTGPDDDSSFEVAGARLTEIMIDKLGPPTPGQRVLDVGCGSGKPGVQLACSTGADVVGISVSTADVEQANARALAEGVPDRARFQHANALQLPFADGSFDHALLLESIVHIVDRSHALTEVARVIRPGGRVALTDFVRRGPEHDDDEDAQDELAEALAAWRAAPLVRAEDYPMFAEQAGLVIDEIIDITAQTMFTYPKTYRAMYEYAEQHDDLPEDLERILGIGLDDDWVVNESNLTEGVIIVVAHRP